MGVIEDIYAELDAEELSESAFREAVEAKVEQMGGLADEETAAMLVAREYDDATVEGVADIEPGIEEAEFAAKVVSVGELRTFERDDPAGDADGEGAASADDGAADGTDDGAGPTDGGAGPTGGRAGDGAAAAGRGAEQREGAEDPPEGRVLNARVADETGQIRITFWDEHADAAAEKLAVGDVLRIAGRPTDGYDGVEVNVNRAEPADDVEIDVDPTASTTVERLSIGASGVTLRGQLLATEPVRTFDRDDGSEGRVSNLVVGDPTGRVRVTLWDGQADRADELEAGVTVEIVDGYVRERDGALELHVGERGRVAVLDDDEEAVEFVPDATPIDAVEIGQTVDVAGVVRSTDPKRTFDRDDGSEGQVRNVRLQDSTGDIRVALWGEKADAEIGPGDELLVADAEIQDGWQDDLEASAGWRATLVPLADGALSVADAAAEGTSTSGTDSERGDAGPAATGLDAFAGDGTAGDSGAGDSGEDAGGGRAASPADGTETGEPSTAGGEQTEFTGIVVQSGSPVILDDGEQTVTVETDAELTLGEEVTVRGTLADGRIDADDVV